MKTVVEGWELILAIGAGTGAVYMLRWYWWRVNAWSEISAMIASASIAISLQIWTQFNWAQIMLITVGVTTIVWLVVTFLTAPVDKECLLKFYKKVRPGGAWGPISKESPDVVVRGTFWNDLRDFLFGSGLVLCSLFGIGKLVLGEPLKGIIYLVVAGVLFYIIYSDLSRREWAVISDE